MKKKLNKLICILLCILLISLSVVSVSASQYYYTNTRDFCNAINPQITANTSSMSSFYSWFVYDVPLDMQIAYDEIIDHYGFTEDSILFADLRYTTTGTTNVQVIIYVADYYPSYAYITRSGASDSIKMNISFPNSAILGVYSVSYNPTTQTFSSYSYTSTTTTSYTFTEGGYKVFYGFYPVHFTCRSTDSNNSYYLNIANNGGGFYNPASGGGGSGSSGDVGNIGDVNWVNFSTLFASYLASNYTFTVNGTTYNPSYSNVGWALAYMFECMENPTLSTITLDNSTMINPVNRLLYGDTTNPTLFDNIKTETVYISSVLDDIEDHGERIGDYLMDLASIYASAQEVEAREAAANNQQAVVDNFLDSQGDGSVSVSNLGDLADSSAEIKSNFNTGYSASGVWDVFDRNWDWFSNTTKNNLEPPAQNVRSANDYETPFLDNAINEILRLRGN